MTGKKLNGYLDHLRENLETLDEQIVNARKMSKKKGKDSNALQWAKILRDFLEARDRTLANIKVHLLGRDESGAPTEPPDYYRGNAEAEVMFERFFKNQLSPWTLDDLKMKCEDCGKESEEVSRRRFPHKYEADEYFDLCDRCYEKRTVKEEESDDSESGEPISNQEAMNVLAEGQEREDDVDLKEAVTDMVRNAIKAIALDGRPPAEKVKMFEELRARLVRSVYSHGSGVNVEPGVVLLDREIDRLQREAELGKGQDADGKPAA